MVIVYSPKSSPRLEFVLEEIFRQRLGLEYRLTEDLLEFEKPEFTTRINYSEEKSVGMQIIPDGLLLETTVNQREFRLEKRENLWLMFGNNSAPGCDIFSMAFWFWSRYEEYLPFTADAHGRFGIANSVLKEGLSEIPVLDLALNHFFSLLQIPVPKKFDIYPTLDMDMGFKYAGKSFLRKLNSLFRSGFNLQQFRDFVWHDHFEKDPFYTLEYEKKVLQKRNARYFFLSGKYGANDKNISFAYPPMAHWVRAAGEYAEVGLHPSYASNGQPELIAKEKATLEKILGKRILRSRQHYLKLNFSTEKNQSTYSHLLHHKIEHDYSMGFADGLGFRAGTACAFHWYDLAEEKRTALKIHPFCAMDVSLKNYLQLSVEDAALKIAELKKTCVENDIPFCFIFHNESLSDHGSWQGWRRVFEKALEAPEK